GCALQMHHAHRRSFSRREKSSIKRDVANVSTGHFQARQLAQIEIVSRRACWENASPNLRAMRRIRKRKVDDETHAPHKRRIEIAFSIRRQHREASIRLHALQEIVDLDVCITVVTVFHFAAFAEERVRFVEEKNRTTIFRRIKHAPQVFLSLADVLTDNTRKVYAIEIE